MNPALTGGPRRQGRWAQLALRGAAAHGAAEAELHDRGADPAIAREALERRFAPAVAVVAVEAEGVLVGEQVAHGVQLDGVHVVQGGLGQAQEVSLPQLRLAALVPSARTLARRGDPRANLRRRPGCWSTRS